MKKFDVWYKDGNKKIFEAPTMLVLVRYLIENEPINDIWHIAVRQ